MDTKTNQVCGNCGKYGHIFHQCKLPITSYGIVAFRSSERGLEFLMIRRKDSFGYIDFIRGKYSSQNIEQIQEKVDEMSISEKEKILTHSFEQLWKMLWGYTSKTQYRAEEGASAKKFEAIKNGIYVNNEFVTLEDIVKRSNTTWAETEWEFPKGRRNFQEKDLDCSLREFEEETGYRQSDVCIIENVLPFEELIIGSNHKSYKHKYYLGYMKNTPHGDLSNFQKSEVSKIEWKTIDECLASIRCYNMEKKKIISNVNKMLQTYNIYC